MRIRHRVTACFVLISAIASMGAHAQSQWIRQAPSSMDRSWRGVYGINANQAWVVGSRETVIQTKDGGQTWINHHTSNADLPPYNAVAFPTALSGFIAGNYSSSLYTGTGGATWSKKSGHLAAIAANKLDFISSVEGFSAYGGALYKTADGGQSWSAVSSALQIIQYSMDFFDSNIGLVSGDEVVLGTGIWKTTDGGVNWTRTYSTAVNALLWLDASRVIAIDGQQVLISNDAGTTWMPFGFMESAGIIGLSRFGNSEVLVAIADSGEIFRSANSGSSWVKVSEETGYALFPDRHASIHCADSVSAWAVADPGLILRSVDQGLTWQQATNSGTVAVTDLDMFDDTFGVAVGSPGYTMTTRDGGKTWRVRKHKVAEYTAAHEEGLGVVDVVDSNFAAAAGVGGLVFKTEDSGATWTSIGYPYWPDTFFIYAIDFVDAQTGWVAGYDFGVGEHMNNLYRTTDGGASWTLVQTQTESRGFFQAGGFRNMYWIDAQRGMLAGLSSDPKMVRTADGGQSWQPVSLPSNWSPPFITDLEFRSAQEGWITGGAGYVCRTLDGGQTWFRLSIGSATNSYVRVVFPGPGKIWIFGAETAFQRPIVMKSSDNGASWTKEQMENYPYTPSAASAMGDGRVWYGTGMGTIHTLDTRLITAHLRTMMSSGGVQTGGIPQAGTSDNTYLSLTRAGEAQLGTMQVQFEAIGPRSRLSRLYVSVESRSIGALATETVELYDVRAKTWIRVLQNGLSSSDDVFSMMVPSGALRYVDKATGKINIRLTLRQDQPAFAPTWEYLIDHVSLRLAP